MNLLKKSCILLSLTSLLACIFLCSVPVKATVVDDSGLMVIDEPVGESYADGRIYYSDIEELVAQHAGVFGILADWSVEERTAYAEMSSYQTNIYTNFVDIIADDTQGDFIKYSDINVTETGEYSIEVTTILEFENKNIKMTIQIYCYDPTYGIGNYVTNAEFTMAGEGDESLGAKMASAAGNTLMGMGTVFIVLIFISFIISMFGVIPKLFEKKNSKNVEKNTENVKADTTAQSDVVTNINDTELIAVIAAAIAASEQVSTDSFVVRSIRRR